MICVATKFDCDESSSMDDAIRLSSTFSQNGKISGGHIAMGGQTLQEVSVGRLTPSVDPDSYNQQKGFHLP